MSYTIYDELIDLDLSIDELNNIKEFVENLIADKIEGDNIKGIK